MTISRIVEEYLWHIHISRIHVSAQAKQYRRKWSYVHMQGCERKIHFQMSKIIPIISSFISYQPLSNSSLKIKHSWSKSNNRKMRICFIIYATCFSLNTVITININMKYKNCPFYVQCPQGDMTVSNVLKCCTQHDILITNGKLSAKLR